MLEAWVYVYTYVEEVKGGERMDDERQKGRAGG